MSADQLTRCVWPGVQIVAEAGRWAVFVPGLPLSADGATFDEAITEMVDALREYGDDWCKRLHDAPNHRDNGPLVEWIGVSSDEQLRDWLIGSSLKV